MARFTERAKDGNIFFPKCFEKCHGVADGSQCANCDHYDRMLEKFAKYEDLEEQGLLLRLPCKVGDTIYSAHCESEKVLKHTVRGLEVRCSVADHNIHDATVLIEVEGYYPRFDAAYFGKTIFHTSEEAEEKIKEMSEIRSVR